jgi:THO complex subunit 3
VCCGVCCVPVGQLPELELKGHTDRVDQLCWHPSSEQTLATTSQDRSVRIWDARASRCVHNIATKGSNINITWSPDANYIAVGNNASALAVQCSAAHTHRLLPERER